MLDRLYHVDCDAAIDSFQMVAKIQTDIQPTEMGEIYLGMQSMVVASYSGSNMKPLCF